MLEQPGAVERRCCRPRGESQLGGCRSPGGDLAVASCDCTGGGAGGHAKSLRGRGKAGISPEPAERWPRRGPGELVARHAVRQEPPGVGVSLRPKEVAPVLADEPCAEKSRGFGAVR